MSTIRDTYGAFIRHVDFGNHRGKNLLDPTDAQDAATKNYVENAEHHFTADQYFNDGIKCYFGTDGDSWIEFDSGDDRTEVGGGTWAFVNTSVELPSGSKTTGTGDTQFTIEGDDSTYSADLIFKDTGGVATDVWMFRMVGVDHGSEAMDLLFVTGATGSLVNWLRADTSANQWLMYKTLNMQSNDILMVAGGIGRTAGALTFDVSNNATFANVVVVSGAYLQSKTAIAVGEPDSQFGDITFFSDGGTSTDGGLLSFTIPPNYDSTYASYSLKSNEDDWEFRQGANTRLTLQGSDGTWLFGANVGMGSNQLTGVADIFVDDGFQIGISGNELLTFNSAGNIALSGADLAMGGNDITGLSTTGSIQWDAGCLIEMASDSILSVRADGYVRIGTGTPSVWTLAEDGDLLVSHELMVNGDFYIHGIGGMNRVTGSNASSWGFYEAGAGAGGFRAEYGRDQFVWFVNDKLGRQIILGSTANVDYDHATTTNPTFFIHSVLSPAVSNNEYLSWAHDGTGAVCATGANTGAGSAPTTIDNYIKFSPRGVEALRIEGGGNGLVAGANKWQFRDAAIYAYSRADGYMSLVADTAIEIGNQTGGNYIGVAASGLFVYYGTAGAPQGSLSVDGNAVETTITVQNTLVQVTIFDTDGFALDAVPAHAQDHITITTAGHYRVTFRCCVETVDANPAVFNFVVQLNNGATTLSTLCSRQKMVGTGGGDFTEFTASAVVDLAAADTVELWVKNETNTNNILITNAYMGVQMTAGT